MFPESLQLTCELACAEYQAQLAKAERERTRRPDPIGMARVKVHPVAAVQRSATVVVHLITRRRGHPGTATTVAPLPIDVEPMATDALP